MHPILVERRRLGLYLLLFAQAGLVLVEVLRVLTGAARWDLWALALPPLLIHAFSCLASWYLCRALPLERTAPMSVLGAQSVSAMLAAGILAGLGRVWAQVLGAAAIDLYGRSVALVFVFGVFLYSLMAATHYVFLAREASRRAQERAYQSQLLAREAELAALRSQLDPHFLFNSLNAISSLTGSDPRQARSMCLRLAEFLRRSLEVGRQEFVPLGDELALVDAYLAVERVRFGERLQVTQEIGSAEAAAVAVPPLLLQPLVENAVRHGLAQLLGAGRIDIRARIENEALELSVENDCDPRRPRRRRSRGATPGIGLANVARRLEVAYHGSAKLTVDDGDETFRARLRLPLEVERRPKAMQIETETLPATGPTRKVPQEHRPTDVRGKEDQG